MPETSRSWGLSSAHARSGVRRGHGVRVRTGCLGLVLNLGLPLLFLTGCAGPGSAREPTPSGRWLQLEEVLGERDPVAFRTPLPVIRWASDGRHLELLRDDQRVWADPISGLERPADEPPVGACAPRAVERALTENLGRTREEARRAVRGLQRAPDDVGALLVLENDLFWFEPGQPPHLRRLTDDSREEREPQLSPDGRWVAFVSDHDLNAVEIASGRVVRITEDGSPERLNGILDWLYQEEVYGRGRWRGFWWSPDSAHLAFLRLDQDGVPVHPLVDGRAAHPVVEPARYPRPGDPNPRAALAIARLPAATRDPVIRTSALGSVPSANAPVAAEVVWVDLAAQPDDRLIVNVDWQPDGQAVVFQVQDRQQTWLELCAGDPATGVVTTWLRETSTSWVDVHGAPRWLSGGDYLWLSERSGLRHLYRYRAGRLLNAVTNGPWRIFDLVHVDEPGGVVWCLAGPATRSDRQGLRARLDGTEQTIVTPEPGTHAIEVASAGDRFLDRHSRTTLPPRVVLRDRDGSVLRELAASARDPQVVYRAPELHRVRARDGFELEVSVLRPVPFDPRASYPVWLVTYSGPEAPGLHDRWSDSAWEQFLAQQGLIVLRVNNRSSLEHHQAVAGVCYQRLGVTELSDLEDAVRWLCQEPWADAARVGITGHSYGGTIAAYALTHSDLFRLGVAGAGVYDWRLYDSIYTERYMRTPADNPDGYRASSCIEAASALRGHLVLGHGTLDENVLFQNLEQFAFALQQAQKSFTVMLYPGGRHGLGDRAQRSHWRRLTWQHIVAELNPRGGGWSP